MEKQLNSHKNYKVKYTFTFEKLADSILTWNNGVHI